MTNKTQQKQAVGKPRPRAQQKTPVTKNVTSKNARNTDVNKSGSGVIPVSSPSVKSVIGANILTAGAVLMLAVACVVMAWAAISAKTEVIATTEDGKVLLPVPLSEAFVTESRVLGFVDECLRASFSHDFENYRRTFSSVLNCYTSLGGKEFARAIDPLLLDIREKRVVMSATTEPPGLRRGPIVINGRAVWEIETIVTLYFQGTRERFAPQRRAATITVVRIPIAENPRGVAINSIQLSPAPPGP